MDDASNEWIKSIMRRLDSMLPHNATFWDPTNEELLAQTVQCIVDLSAEEFGVIANSLGQLLQDLIKSHPPFTATEKEVESYYCVLDCIAKCLAQRTDTALGDDDLQSLQQLYSKITQLCLLNTEVTERISSSAHTVLYHMSGLHFHGIFNKIILRVTSVSRAGSANNDCSDPSEHCVIQLIPHLNLNAARLQQILQVIVTSFKDLRKHKQLFVSLPPILHKSIWNFISAYPSQFNELLNDGFPSLTKSAEKLFNLCDEYADSQKKRSLVWPLQNTLLIISPHILKDIVEDSGENVAGKYRAQRAFITSMIKGLSSSTKQTLEAAVLCGADMFKICSYVYDKNSAVFRYFLTQIQSQLQHLLFSPNSAYLHEPSSIAAGIPTFTDFDLMVTCLVAQFRCNHRNTHIFSICLSQDSPPVFKAAFVNSVYIILKEKHSLHWWPNPEAIYTYGSQLREIFQNALSQLRRYDTPLTNLHQDTKLYLQNPTASSNMLLAKGKAERKLLVEIITNYQLLRGLIRVFHFDPLLTFNSAKDKDPIQEHLQLMTGLVSLVQHQSLPLLPLGASEVLLALHTPDNILLWNRNDCLGAFWDISGQVTYAITLKLFSRKTSNAVELLQWLQQILHYRTQFLCKRESEAHQGSTWKVSQQMYAMLETVLLLFLRNTNVTAVQVAMSCFRYLVSEAELLLNPNEPSPIPYSANLAVYKHLDVASNSLLIGRAAQQKKIRGIMRDLVHTPGSALAWEDTYSSWRVAKAMLVNFQCEEATPPEMARFSTESFPRNIMKKVSMPSGGGGSMKGDPQPSEETLQAALLNWTNMTGFLCSLAGVSTKPSTTTSPFLFTSNGSGSGSSLNSAADNVDPPPVMYNTLTRDSKVKRSSSYHGNRPKSVAVTLTPVRTTTGESPTHTSMSADSCEDVCSPHQGGPGGPGGRASQTSVFISELMQLLSCDNEVTGVNIRETVKELVSYELSPSVFPCLFQCINMEFIKVFNVEGVPLVTDKNTALVEQLISIVQHILETKTERALEHLNHIKMDEIVLSLVQYVDCVESPSERSITLKIKLCHLVETITQRSKELSFRQEVQFRNQLANYLTCWVEKSQSLSDTITHTESLQNELDLSAMKAVGLVLHNLVLQPKDSSGDVIEEKGKLFLRHFNSFLNLIHSLNGVDWSALSSIHKQGLTRHVASLREATIKAMSNMLTANIDSGLTHAIGLGYDDDLQTRASFIEVLTSILKQGAEFHSLAETTLADRYTQMLDLLISQTSDEDFPVAMALLESVPPENLDELTEVLILLFDEKNRLAAFLERILSTEVEAVESGRLDTLFRGNSIACKVLSSCFKTFGLYYLQSVVRPLILSLVKSCDKEYEVDPARLEDKSKLETNRGNVLELIDSFYSKILSSLPSLPLQIRTVCHVLYSVVFSYFPESSIDTVNSAIFLRFINPAIVSPQSYSLVQGEIQPEVRRGLTFISKVLQNLANHVLFKKEAHMGVFNDFLTGNFERSRELALRMASMGPYMEGEAVEFISFLKDSDKYRLHNLLWSNNERIAAYAASTRTSVSARDLFHKLNTLLAQLGAPSYRKRRCSLKSRSALMSSQMEEFLDTMANECDDRVLRSIKAKEIFYQAGTSKAGCPVFYFIARKFRGDQLHIPYQILYHMMSLLKAYNEKAFELVIDLTQASPVNEPDLELLVKFAAYVPELAMCSIEGIYLYNCNTYFRQYANKLATSVRIFAHIKGAKRVVMVDNIHRFSEFIEPQELRLPTTTLEFEGGGKEFTNVHHIIQRQVTYEIPATLMLVKSAMVVMATDKVRVFDIPTTLKEIYHVADIREVFAEGKNSFVVRLIDGGQLVKFTSPDAEVLVKSLNAAVSAWQNQQPSRYLSERKMEPKDVPGTFLNLALLNLGSTEASLRIAAYKLLGAVKDAFHFRINKHLECSHELCIPMNSAQFVVSISEELAKSEAHLTVEFLSEVVAGFQHYTPSHKQLCLAYISPWIPNLAHFVHNDSAPEQEKVTRLIDLLVALTISEAEMYPLIQTHVWSRMWEQPDLIKKVLDHFIKLGIVDGIGSRKLEVLADTTTSLAKTCDNVAANEIMRKILTTIAHTTDSPVSCLVQNALWPELAVLTRFLLALSFNNKINVVKYLPDVFFIVVIMCAQGPPLVRATIHGIALNTVQALASAPSVFGNVETHKAISLKLAELSQSKFYLQFGIQTSPSVASYQPSPQATRLGQDIKDTLSSASVVSISQYLLEILQICSSHFPNCGWLARWQTLARRTALHFNPALQSRSFLLLGVISTQADSRLVTRALRVLADMLSDKQEEIMSLEPVVICLTQLVPLLKEELKLVQHLFWVAVGLLQLGDSTLYASGLGLLEACVKFMNQRNIFENQSLATVLLLARKSQEFPLNQMDKQVAVSFNSDFHFALSVLLYKGFFHPLSTVRTHTQELLTTLLFIHTPGGKMNGQCVNEDNLAYIAALFPESDILRGQLQDLRPRRSATEEARESVVYSSLLSPTTIPDHKTQILFLLMLASALIQSQEDQKVRLLYRFLADASEVYSSVFPLIYGVLSDHMARTLQQGQCTQVIGAVQRIVKLAVKCDHEKAVLRPTFIKDEGFGGVVNYFSPFVKQCPTQTCLFKQYLDSLIQELSPEEKFSHHSRSVTNMRDTTVQVTVTSLFGSRRSESSSSMHEDGID